MLTRILAIVTLALLAACTVDEPIPADEEVSLGMACEVAQCQCRAVRQPVFGKTIVEPPEWHLDGNAYCREGFVLERLDKGLF